MDLRCRTTRDRLAFGAGPDAAPAEEDRRHLAVCADCRAWERALRRREDALRGLRRLEAPESLAGRVAAELGSEAREARSVAALHRLAPVTAPEALDGLVVASLQAGARQERALRHLGGLARLEAPELAAIEPPSALADESLDSPTSGAEDVVRDLRPRTSPAVLERLVAEDLGDLPRALTRRFSDKLRRVPAPAALEDRVRAELAGEGAIGTGAGRRRVPVGLHPLAAAAAVVLFSFLGWAAWRAAPGAGAPDPGSGDRVAIDVRRLDGPGGIGDTALSPLARDVVGDLAGPRLAVEGLDRDLLADAGAGDGTGDGTGGDSDEDDAGQEPGEDGTDGAGAPGDGSGGAAPNGSAAHEDTTAARAQSLPRDLLDRMHAAQRMPVRLVRVVDRRDPDAVLPRVVLKEEVLRDGLGAFSVRATDVVHPPMNDAAESTLLLLQGARQGFVERYRDFRLRDVALFRQNHVIVDLGAVRLVAGVPCRVVEVQRRDGTGFTWRLAVDPTSGLVLAEERADASGAVVLRTEVLQVERDPDLSGAVLDGGPTLWTEADAAALEAAGELHVPTALPDGYVPTAVETRADAQGREWVRQGFTDGVSQLFLLHERAASLPASFVARNGRQAGAITVVPVGGQLVLDGEVRGVRVVAFGPIGEYPLLQLVDSALP